MILIGKHLLWLLLSTGIIYLVNTRQNNLSHTLGYLVLLGNLIVLTVVWSISLRKNLVALSFLIIVFKYTIMIAAIYWILSLPQTNVFWVFLGIMNFVIATVLFGIIWPNSKKQNLKSDTFYIGK